MSDEMMTYKLVEFEPGHAGKSGLLDKALRDVISDGRFDDMSVAEIVGTLELLKDSLSEAVRKS